MEGKSGPARLRAGTTANRPLRLVDTMADKASLWKPANDPRTGENAHRTTCRCHRRRCQTRAPAVLSESPVQRSLTARGHRTPGRTYYYNKQTRETTWTKPLELSSPEERVRSRCCAAYPLQRPARLHGRPGAPCDDGPEGLGPRTHAPTHTPTIQCAIPHLPARAGGCRPEEAGVLQRDGEQHATERGERPALVRHLCRRQGLWSRSTPPACPPATYDTTPGHLGPSEHTRLGIPANLLRELTSSDHHRKAPARLVGDVGGAKEDKAAASEPKTFSIKEISGAGAETEIPMRIVRTNATIDDVLRLTPLWWSEGGEVVTKVKFNPNNGGASYSAEALEAAVVAHGATVTEIDLG